jgi:hypothetical protein
MKIEEEVAEKAMFGLQLNSVVEMMFVSGLLVLWDVIDEDCFYVLLAYCVFFYPFSTLLFYAFSLLSLFPLTSKFLYKCTYSFLVPNKSTQTTTLPSSRFALYPDSKYPISPFSTFLNHSLTLSS